MMRAWKMVDCLGLMGCVMFSVAGCGRSAATHTIERISADAPAPDEGWLTLFDGTSTKGWAVYREDDGPLDPDDFFVQDGAIACKGLGYHWFRYEAREFGDFILQFEFKMNKRSNSGVCLRTTKTGSPPYTGFEVQILDEFGKPPHLNSCGAIYDVVAPTSNAAKPPGEWNSIEVTCRGPLVVVVLNGTKVVDTDFSKFTEPIGKFSTPYAQLPKSGYIALQDHWKPITFYRNIRIKPL